uniref:protein JTB isoform X1 n=1 Tax=Pristiophorus japonicus TaxID=55135 RepID=UPI00398E5391
MLQLVELVELLIYLCTMWSMFTSFRVCAAVPLQSERNTTSILQPRPCWEKEEFSIVKECAPCSDYEKTVHVECTFTGFVEEVKCTSDQKYRSSSNSQKYLSPSSTYVIGSYVDYTNWMLSLPLQESEVIQLPPLSPLLTAAGGPFWMTVQLHLGACDYSVVQLKWRN